MDALSKRQQLDKAVFAMLELEVQNYYESKADLEQIEDANYQGIPLVVYWQKQRLVVGIERAIRKLLRKPNGKLKQRMVSLVYWQDHMRQDEICLALNISKQTLYRWRKEFINLVADCTGYEI